MKFDFPAYSYGLGGRDGRSHIFRLLLPPKMTSDSESGFSQIFNSGSERTPAPKGFAQMLLELSQKFVAILVVVQILWPHTIHLITVEYYPLQP